MTKTEAVQVNLIYLIINSSIFLVDTSDSQYLFPFFIKGMVSLFSVLYRISCILG